MDVAHPWNFVHEAFMTWKLRLQVSVSLPICVSGDGSSHRTVSMNYCAVYHLSFLSVSSWLSNPEFYWIPSDEGRRVRRQRGKKALGISQTIGRKIDLKNNEELCMMVVLRPLLQMTSWVYQSNGHSPRTSRNRIVLLPVVSLSNLHGVWFTPILKNFL